jgi:hypothetical protein
MRNYPPFPKATPHLQGRLPTRSSPVRHAATRRPRVRLACIRHAASVDPEPGSNSPPKCLLCTGFQTRAPKRSGPTRRLDSVVGRPARGARSGRLVSTSCCAFSLEPRPIPRPARRRRPPCPGHPRRSSAHSVFHGPGLPSVRILVNVLSVRISGPKISPSVSRAHELYRLAAGVSRNFRRQSRKRADATAALSLRYRLRTPARFPPARDPATVRRCWSWCIRR